MKPSLLSSQTVQSRIRINQKKINLAWGVLDNLSCIDMKWELTGSQLHMWSDHDGWSASLGFLTTCVVIQVFFLLFWGAETSAQIYDTIGTPSHTTQTSLFNHLRNAFHSFRGANFQKIQTHWSNTEVTLCCKLTDPGYLSSTKEGRQCCREKQWEGEDEKRARRRKNKIRRRTWKRKTRTSFIKWALNNTGWRCCKSWIAISCNCKHTMWHFFVTPNSCSLPVDQVW